MRGSVGPTESPEDPSQGPRGPRDPADGPGGSPGRPAGGPAGGPGSHPFDLLSHGIILVNEYGDVVWMNEVATERLTRDGSYHDGASHSQVFHAAGVQCLEGTQGVPACPVRACLRERHVVRSAKAKIFASSGSELVADLHLTPIPELASIVVGQDGPGVIVSFVETSPALAATRELRAYRQQAQAAERLAGMGSFWWDLETGEVTLSEAMKDLTVLGDEFEGTYEHGIEQILPDLRGGVEEMVAHAIQTGEPFEFEEHRGGDEAPVKHVRVRAEVAFGEDGRPSAIVGYVRDITQEYEAQQELELRQQRLEEAQRVARMGSWEYDVGQDEMRWSVGMYELFDQDPDTFVPSFQAHREIVLEEDRAIADAVRAKLDELGESYEYTVRYHKADGGVGWIRCRARTEPGASDGDLRIIGTVQDVTHEHAASVEVSRSEALLNEAQEVAHIGSWSWNIADDLITWSDELFRLYGLEPGGAAPDFETYLSMVHPEDRELAGGVVAKAMEDRQPFEFEHRLLRQDDGEERWLHGRGRVVLDDEDNLVRMVGTAHDITDRKRAELAVEEARGKLME